LSGDCIDSSVVLRAAIDVDVDVVVLVVDSVVWLVHFDHVLLLVCELIGCNVRNQQMEEAVHHVCLVAVAQQIEIQRPFAEHQRQEAVDGVDWNHQQNAHNRTLQMWLGVVEQVVANQRQRAPDCEDRGDRCYEHADAGIINHIKLHSHLASSNTGATLELELELTKPKSNNKVDTCVW
jgi:hypothetical protein